MSDPYADIHKAAVNAYLELCDADDEGTCVCEDCVVRTILDSIFDALLELAREETRTDVVIPSRSSLEPICGYPGR